MAEIVLTTDLQYSKGESVFRSASGFTIEVAPGKEQPLADVVSAKNCRAVIVGAEPFSGPLYQALAKNGGDRGAIIARFGVGYDSIDLALAREHNIVVTNTPGVLDVSVAEHVMWLMGSLAKHVSRLDARIRSGQYAPQTGIEVFGKTLGIVGFGVIGRRVAAVAHNGFGMRVIAVDCLSPRELEQREGKPIDQIKAELGIDLYTNDPQQVLREADFVSFHLPSTDQTRKFVNAQRLAMMKSGAMLINTGRGTAVDEDALYDALSEGRIAAAALDVSQAEPYQPVSPDKDLRTLDNVVMTPHTASNTEDANRRIAESAIRNVSNFLAGRLDELNRVDLGS